MNYKKKSIRDVSFAGKKVLLRVDFNVPLDKTTHEITNDKRIRAALPTIQYLLDDGAALIVCSHLGKPKKDPDAKTDLTLKRVAVRFAELLGKPVEFAEDTIGPDAKAKAAALKPGQVLLLENTRFDPREEKNDPEFAKELASMADVYVSDAFGAVHRAHASTAGVADYLPAYCGFLVEKELTALGGAMDDPKRPLVAVLGGAKVADKLAVIENLLKKADTLVIGGGMAFTFLKAKGYETGASLLDEEKIDYCKNMLAKAEESGVKLLLPVDVVVADKFAADAESKVVAADECAKRIESGKYDVVICNLANCDMVGHTGVKAAAIQAVETVDACVGQIVEAVKKMGGVVLITADHGNADRIMKPDGSPDTAHTTNPVPLIVSGADVKLRPGRLCDLCPTMLDLMGLAKPAQMTGESLIVK